MSGTREIADSGLWNTQRVAAEIGVSIRTVHRYRRTGKLRGVNVGAGSKPRWRFDANAVRSFKCGEIAPPPVASSSRRRRRQLSNAPDYFGAS
jgi:predicted site-specific integrase-resolvase